MSVATVLSRRRNLRKTIFKRFMAFCDRKDVTIRHDKLDADTIIFYFRKKGQDRFVVECDFWASDIRIQDLAKGAINFFEPRHIDSILYILRRKLPWTGKLTIR